LILVSASEQITKVVFTTSWNLLSSSLNRGVISTTATIVRLLGVAHQSFLLYSHKLALLVFFPSLAKSGPELKKYTVELMEKSMEVRKEHGGVRCFRAVTCRERSRVKRLEID
jgi:hypothetical protein